MGATREQIARVQQLGYAGWINEQIAMPRGETRWNYLVGKQYNTPDLKNTENGHDAAFWRKMIIAPDTLRQRVTLALSEIVVASITGFSASWSNFSGVAHMDLLESHAFGNYRNLLQQVSLSAPMGEYLTYRGNVKLNPTTGALPDENYAREVIQLFSIGLVELNLDGTPKLSSGLQQETYGLDDISGLARVFTGWGYDLAGGDMNNPEYKRRPMIVSANRHESGAKEFLGSSIPAGTDALNSVTRALDIIFAHPNVAPFISRQLIQRLVTSNPSPAYVSRVATVFNNDGKGVKGNLAKVVAAILLDDEARNPNRLSDPNFGKLREPVLRFTAWARAFKANSPSDAWGVGNTSDPGTRLGQSPGRSSTVFNFFRPGYVPPNSAIASARMVAPEFQITNESTVVGYVNFMQSVVSRGINDVKADYSAVLPLAESSDKLVDELNLVLAAGQLAPATVNLIKGGIDSMPKVTDTHRLNRIYAALVLVLASPEFIVQK